MKMIRMEHLRIFTNMYFLLILLLFIKLAYQSPDEYRLIQDLKENYDVVERPVRNHSYSLPVKVRIILQQIVDVDEKNQAMTLVVWTQITWTDYKLEWRPAEYGNITNIQLPKQMIWTPDILLYNSVNSNFDSTFAVNCVVSQKGEVLMAPPGIVKISCDMTMTWFPFDEQICYMKFGSWTYSGSFVDLNIDNPDENGLGTIDMSYYLANEEFDIIETIAKRTSKIVKGEPHIELYFMIILRRRSLYYTLNWITPSILISISNVLQFMMPTAGGEKVTLQTTNVLATLVFLTQIAKTTPTTSESIPVLSAVFSASLCIMGASTCATVLIMNVHFRSGSLREMGPWTRNVFLHILPKILRMSSGVEKSQQAFSEEAPSIEYLSGTLQQNESLIRAKKMKKQAEALQSSLSFGSTEELAIYSQMEYSINEVIKVLLLFEDNYESSRKEKRLESDWKYMANVLDRVCLLLYFILFSCVSLVIILFPK